MTCKRHRLRQVLEALQDAMNHIENSDCLAEFQVALEEIRQLQVEHEKEVLLWSQKEADAEMQRAHSTSLKEKLARVRKELEKTERLGGFEVVGWITRSDLKQKQQDLSELKDGQALNSKDWIGLCKGRSEEAKRKMAELDELRAEDEKKRGDNMASLLIKSKETKHIHGHDAYPKLNICRLTRCSSES